MLSSPAASKKAHTPFDSDVFRMPVTSTRKANDMADDDDDDGPGMTLKKRKLILRQVSEAMRMGDLSVAAGTRTPEVLVDPLTAARAISLIHRNEAANTALRVLIETMLGGSVEAHDEHGRSVDMPPDVNNRVQETLRPFLMDALRMMLVWGVVVFGVRSEPVKDTRTGAMAFTEDGKVRMTVSYYVPQDFTFAITTWKDGSRQRYAFYEYVSHQSSAQGGGTGGGAIGGPALAGGDRIMLSTELAKRAYSVVQDYNGTPYQMLTSTEAASIGNVGTTGGGHGSFVLNENVVILDHFRQQPNVITGALSSRLVSSMRAFNSVERDDELTLMWREMALAGGYSIEEHSTTAAKAADAMITPATSVVPPAYMADGLSTEMPAGVQGGTSVAAPTENQLKDRGRVLAASAATMEIATVQEHMRVQRTLGVDGTRWAQSHMPGFGRWRIAAPGSRLTPINPPPEPRASDDHHQMRLQEATATMGINRELIMTPSGRNMLGHVAVVMDTQRQSMDYNRRSVNHIIEEAISLAHRYTAAMRANQMGTPVRGPMSNLVFEDFINFDDLGGGKSKSRVARLAYPSTAYTSGVQLRELYGLGILSWEQFGAPMLRAAGMDTSLFYDARKRGDPNPPEVRIALVGASVKTEGGGAAGSSAGKQKTPVQAEHKDEKAIEKK